ncbi:ATP-dependent DNA helicase UvrD1 [Caloramator mitchellensis]|uniref:DNA 3'-5' helicase n=1 Tax=Caloramator mitchellensis TaxID=908809 RepID=A0A0R3JU89_CALMK|nr:UvrD-helicase domain-containing protein [Caloramator mitchellensis]KRQ87139.1 ATP-dependent DNA helicase UvrD1 [Caloramator mitchellensis]
MDIERIKSLYDVNDEQATALDINQNIALHAGAGSGKTRVLTRRYLRLLLETDCQVDDIVAITFTKKAALEMKSRVLELVNHFLNIEDKYIDRTKLRRIKEDINLSNISTFHSFCDSIIREYYYKLGLEPMYQIIEEVDAETLLTRFADEVVEEFLSDSNNETTFEILFDTFGIDYVIKKDLHSDLKELYKRIREKAEDIEKVEAYTYGSLKRYYNESIDEKIIEKYENIQLLILKMIQLIDKKYSEFKKNENLVDFNDLEIYMIKLLENFDDVRKNIKQRFKYFMIDEFQDTNDVQLKILLNLVENEDKSIDDGKLFIVGDIKQSIYAFRGTNYKVFSETTKLIEKKGKKHTLSVNYRSHDSLVEIINQMFKNMIPDYDELKTSGKIEGLSRFEYKFIDNIKEKSKSQDDSIKNIKNKLKGGRVSLEELGIFINKIEEKLEIKIHEEAAYIAERISYLISKGFQYRDIAILLRDRNNLKEYEEELKRSNIPYTILGGIGYFEKQEVIDLINFLKYIYRKNDEVALLGILRSPFVGVSDDDIVDIFKRIKSGLKLKEAIQILSDEKGIVKNTILKVESLKNTANFYSTYSFLKILIEELNIKEVLLGFENGVQKYRNIEKLLEIAKEFDRKGLFTPVEFLDYIENLNSVSKKEGEAFLDTEESNAVKIMTVHASKGLEFEVVFVPALEKELFKKNKRRIIFDATGIIDANGNIQKYGIVVEHKIDGLATSLFDYLVNKKYEEEKEEAIRLLYVAATRAIRYLCFSGYKASEDKKESLITSLMKNNLEELSNKTLDFDNYLKMKIAGETESLEDVDLNEIKTRIDHSFDYKSKFIASVSRYLSFMECPRKYYFKYIAKLDEDYLIDETEYEEDERIKTKQLKASLRGNIVHSILENIVRNRDINLDDYDFEIKRYIDNFYIIENKLYKNIQGQRIKSETELQFRVPLSNSTMSLFGIMDRVDILEVGDKYKAIIIDYKTNKINNEEDKKRVIEYYKPQFAAYEFGFNKIFNNIYKDIEILGMYLYLLDIGEYIDIKITNDERKKITDELIKTFEFIDNSSKFEVFQKGKCSENCKYSKICLV